jgi:hypothetical protein
MAGDTIERVNDLMNSVVVHQVGGLATSQLNEARQKVDGTNECVDVMDVGLAG